MKLVAIIAAMAVAFFGAALSACASGDEVLVVANADSDDSKALAQAYMDARKIPKENLLLVKTTAQYEISRNNYEKQIRLPIKQYLSQNKRQDRIRCVCLVYGVPVRLAPMQLPAPARELLNVYTCASSKASRRLAEDCQYLDTVGEKFPEARATGVRAAGKILRPAAEPSDPADQFRQEAGQGPSLAGAEAG